MSKSLNQAFIKAYSKEKAGEKQSATPVAQAGTSDSSESLMMRFDTLSVPIPRPHLLQRQQRSEKVPAEPLPQSTQAAGRKNQPIVDPSHGKDSADRELRESIASQMMRAGHWEDQHWDAFLTGFPMLSAVHAPLAMVEQNGAQPAKAVQDAVSSLGQSKSAPDVPESTNQAQSAPRSAVSAALKAGDLAGGRNADPKAVENASLPPQKPSQEEPPSLVPPKAPAINPAQNIPAQNIPAQNIPAQNIPAEYLHAEEAADEIRGTSRDGEIFRLDRPTYSANSHPDQDADADSGEQSSLLDGSRDQKTNADLEPLRRPHAKVDTRRVEEDLRNAKVRIFNPVWEVDNLQWPEVCLELLDHNASDVERVAQNLISACQEGLQVLAVTSPHSGEGKTTVACCLAILAGSRGLKVAILDGDIENPSLSLQTNLEVDQDWKSAIVNQMPLEEVAVHSIDDQVTIVPLLQPIVQSEMASDDDRIALMLQELSESFDLVIVDMGHMESQRNLVTAMAEHGIISAVVAVVDRRSSTQQHVEACVRRIQQSGVASIGLIENFAA